MLEEFFNQAHYESIPNGYRYAILFAQDCNPEAIYGQQRGDHPTATFSALALAVGKRAEYERLKAEVEGRPFFAVAYVEQAAEHYNRNPQATFEQVCEAGQLESDSLANST